MAGKSCLISNQPLPSLTGGDLLNLQLSVHSSWALSHYDDVNLSDVESGIFRDNYANIMIAYVLALNFIE